jgi:hypothetical protein
MPKRIQTPDGPVEFPDDMQDSAIEQVLRKQYGGPSTESQHPVLDSVVNFGKGVAKGALNTVSSADDFARAHLPAFLTNSSFGFGPPADLARMHSATQTHGTAQAIGKGIEQAGEFLIPGGAEEKLAARMGGGIAARIGARAIGGAAVNKAQGGSLLGGALAGGIGEGIAGTLRSVAPKIAESAMNVGGRDRLYGRTVGEALLEDTSGVRPSTIQQSAKAKIAALTPEVEQVAASAGNSGARGSIAPARQVVAATNAGHIANRAVGSAEELQPLQGFLAKDAVTGLPLAEQQTPSGLLALKRGVNSDFITRWKPENQGLAKEAQKVYGTLAEEFHNAAPGTAELDQRISSLIPVAERAGAASRGASLTQNVLHKFKAPTGALTGAFAGGTAGYEQGHSIPSALIGAGIGAVAPAVIASPELQMTLARSAYAPAVSKYIVPTARGIIAQPFRKDKDSE